MLNVRDFIMLIYALNGILFALNRNGARSSRCTERTGKYAKGILSIEYKIKRLDFEPSCLTMYVEWASLCTFRK